MSKTRKKRRACLAWVAGCLVSASYRIDCETVWGKRGHVPRTCFPYSPNWPKNPGGIPPLDHFIYFDLTVECSSSQSCPSKSKYPPAGFDAHVLVQAAGRRRVSMAPFPLRNRPPSLPAATCPGTTRAIDVAPYNVIPGTWYSSIPLWTKI